MMVQNRLKFSKFLGSINSLQKDEKIIKRKIKPAILNSDLSDCSFSLKMCDAK